MSSRSSVGAVVFVVLLLGIGFFVANRGEQKVSEAPAPAPEASSTTSTTATSPTDDTEAASSAAPATDAASPAPPAQQADAAPSSDQATATPDAAPAAEDAVGDAASETSDVKSAPATTADGQAPTYDLVRVEPSGDAVIAGRASPGATIELVVNGKVVASTVANATGEWVMVLDQPLAPGDYDIALQSSNGDTKTATVSQDRLAVSIPATGGETPMVALSRPNAPVEVLQKPAATITAAATPAAPAATRQPEAEADVAAAAPASGKSDRSASAPTVLVDTAEGGVAQGATTPADTASTAPRPSAGAGGGETVIGHLTVREDAPAVPVEKPVAPADSASTAAAPADGAAPGSTTAMPAAKPVAVAAADGTAAGQPAEETVPVSIEIAEAEGDTFRLQGMSKPGADVWIYLAGEFIGEAKAGETGRWSFEEKMAFEEGDYSIRVDQVANRAGAVATRAEVPFAFKRAGEAPAAVATGKDGGPKVAVLDETEEGVRVLIRRGDNLWTIAHHFYGDGFSYANIYRENNGQIRNPHLIYPGQVFVMPGLSKKDVTGVAKKRAL